MSYLEETEKEIHPSHHFFPPSPGTEGSSPTDGQGCWWKGCPTTYAVE